MFLKNCGMSYLGELTERDIGDKNVLFIGDVLNGCSLTLLPRGVNPGELRPLDFGQGGREILLYLIMHRKYVRKW